MRSYLTAAIIAPSVAAALVVATVLSGSPAHAQTCTDDPPTPTGVAVTAVPIVATSTTTDYFVLYASHDVASTTAEYPVQVILGEDGTTTLSENVAALPIDRYRVERYLVADPADVDGDCTDDITELGDPAGMNPVNPAHTVELREGAVVISDWETFEALGVTDSSGNTRVKFTLFDMDTDRPGIYFQNTKRFRWHRDFLNAIGVGRQGTSWGRLIFDPNFVAPDGSRGIYRYRIPSTIESFSFWERTHTLLAASLPLLDDNLAL